MSNLVTPQQELLEAIKSISYFTVTLIFLSGVIIFVGKLVVTKIINRYYESVDERNKKLEDVSSNLNNIMSEIRLIIDRLDSQAKIQSEIKEDVKERVTRVETNFSYIVEELEAKYKAGIERVNKDASILDTREVEHYKELKGKISRQWDDISRLKDQFIKLQVNYDHHHPPK